MRTWRNLSLPGGVAFCVNGYVQRCKPTLVRKIDICPSTKKQQNHINMFQLNRNVKSWPVVRWCRIWIRIVIKEQRNDICPPILAASIKASARSPSLNWTLEPSCDKTKSYAPCLARSASMGISLGRVRLHPVRVLLRPRGTRPRLTGAFFECTRARFGVNQWREMM